MTDPCPNAACFGLRAAVRWCVCLLLAVVVVQTWFLDGLVSPYRIAGGSMAGALLGRHRDVACADCGCTFACGTEALPVSPRAVCPNCGYAADQPDSALPDVPGERVLIDRAAFSLRPPRRWEIVAFRRAGPADAILVKRVVGLPGETLDIRNGDVYVDGRIQRKNLSQQRAMAVLVHDANFQPAREPKPPPRWQAQSAESRWRSNGERFIHAAGPDDESIDWLEYHHWQRLMGESGDVRESPVTDVCGYNQSQPRREEDVHAVADLMLSFRLAEATGRGVLAVRATDGHDDFEARLQFGDDRPRYQIFHAGQPMPDAAGEIPAKAGPRIVEVSLIDQQFLLAIDGQTLVARSFERSEPASPPACPLAVGVEGLAATLGDLRVYRDIYYTAPLGEPARPEVGRPVRLGAGEYYVLGDNSPVSEDSRTWPNGGAIDAKFLVGKPLAAIPSVQLTPWGDWHFQVPNPARIRYIR